MFYRIKNQLRQLRRKLTEPTQENSPSTSEPKVVSRAGRPKIHESATQRVRAWREKQKRAKQIAPLKSLTPELEIILPAPSIAVASSEQIVTSRIPWDALRSLRSPGPAARLSALSAPPIVEARRSPIEPVRVAEPSTVEAEPTPSDQAQTFAPIPTSTAWEPDWAQELRTDLPMRTPEEIARLLKFETREQTARRIVNDLERNLNSRLRWIW